MRVDAQRNRDLLLAAAVQVFAERGTDAPLDDVARRAGVGNATLYRHFPTRSDLLIAVYADEVTQLCASAETLRSEAASPREALHEWLRLFMDHVATKPDLAFAPPARMAAGWDVVSAGAEHQGTGRQGAGRDVPNPADEGTGRNVSSPAGEEAGRGLSGANGARGGAGRKAASGHTARVATGRHLPRADTDTDQVAGWHRAMLTAASSLLADAVRAGDVRADLDVRDLLTLVKGITLAAEDRTQAERLLSLVNW
ncbi:hypothetical protein GCM10009850_101910 [Nonomuraea monospora]|uniref:HTH tetR-type domain-containing protein n=1 Tax=Nonomuraea monospora TaxID=568818 RepID=A0ABP5PSQ6_9ACTN